jgi:hypothetical protein
VYRPVALASQAKNARLATPAHSGAPPVYRPFAATSQLRPAGAPPVYRPFASASQPNGRPSVAQGFLLVLPAQVQIHGKKQPYYGKTRTVIQLAPSIRTADTNIKGLENNIKHQAGTARPYAGITDRAYPGITAAKYQLQFAEFTYKGSNYHLSYTSVDQYHVTDESAGRIHYWFKIGTDELEDIHEWPPGPKGHDKPLSDLPEDVHALVKFLFSRDLPTPGTITAQKAKEDRIKEAAERWRDDSFESYDDALAAAREDEHWEAAWWE